MEIVYRIVLGLGLAVAVLFAILVYVYSKGDAMGGGGGIRTTFKGKAGFDDIISKVTLYLGIAFMALMVLVNVIGNYAFRNK